MRKSIFGVLIAVRLTLASLASGGQVPAGVGMPYGLRLESPSPTGNQYYTGSAGSGSMTRVPKRMAA